jgi:hypothetical protein
MEITAKAQQKICYVNKNAFPAGTSWKTMHQAGEAAYPGFVTKIHTPGEFMDGEMTPRSYEGQFFPVESDYVLVSISTEEVDTFHKEWESEHPVPEGLKLIQWAQDRNQAQYEFFRALFEVKHHPYKHCSMKVSYETESCLDVEEDVEENAA